MSQVAVRLLDHWPAGSSTTRRTLRGSRSAIQTETDCGSTRRTIGPARTSGSELRRAASGVNAIRVSERRSRGLALTKSDLQNAIVTTNSETVFRQGKGSQ